MSFKDKQMSINQFLLKFKPSNMMWKLSALTSFYFLKTLMWRLQVLLKHVAILLDDGPS